MYGKTTSHFLFFDDFFVTDLMYSERMRHDLLLWLTVRAGFKLKSSTEASVACRGASSDLKDVRGRRLQPIHHNLSILRLDDSVTGLLILRDAKKEQNR